MDMLDSINKTSKDNPDLINIDQKAYTEIKKELLQIISNYDNRNNLDFYYNTPTSTKKFNTVENAKNKRITTIGLLSYALMDEQKFPDIESINKFTEKSLNLTIKNWRKRSRYEIIGVFIANIANNPDVNIEQFIDPWKEFVANQNNIIISKSDGNRKEFVDVWLDFFEKYKERNK